MIKTLMISTDAKIFEEGTPVRARMQEYGALFHELHIVVLTPRGFSKAELSGNTFIYPTNSASKLLYVVDGFKLANSIMRESGLQATDSVITAQDPFETGLVGMRLSKASGIPLHIQIHTDFKSPYFKGNSLNKIRRALSKMTLAHARAVRAVSERIRSSLSSQIAAKTSVLPIFAEIDLIQNAPMTIDLRKKYPQFEKVALVASRLTVEKDLVAAIDAFSAAQASYPRAGLIIVGSGPEEAKLRSKVAALGLIDKVIFEPWADRDTILSYMKTCDAFVSASLYEGYGLSMLEASMAGAPLVTTNAGIAPVLTQNVCTPGDAVCLARMLEMAFSGKLQNKAYEYPYPSKEAFLEEYAKDIERALL